MRRNHVFGFALALAAATTAQTASAQETLPAQGHEQHAGEGRRQQGGGQFQRLFQGIQLSDAQQQQIRQIFEEGRPQRGDRAQGQRGQDGEGRQRGERRELTAEQRAQFEKRREEMQQRRQQQIARVRGILSSEQRAQFDGNVAQADSQRQQRGQRGDDRGQGRS